MSKFTISPDTQEILDMGVPDEVLALSDADEERIATIADAATNLPDKQA